MHVVAGVPKVIVFAGRGHILRVVVNVPNKSVKLAQYVALLPKLTVRRIVSGFKQAASKATVSRSPVLTFSTMSW